MKAMILKSVTDLEKNSQPLEYIDLPVPVAAPDELLLKVLACGVCHTELDEIEGRTSPSKFPVIPGHQVIGIIEKTGKNASRWKRGTRVGVAWINRACGKCSFCKAGKENLCINFSATGRDADGGYAEFMTVHQDFVYQIPDVFTHSQAAPLLCAGAVGYRSLMLTGVKNGQNLGLTGFGASAHLVLQAARYLFPDTKIFVIARSTNERDFASELGAAWTGESLENAPAQMDCIIDTTPVWKPVIDALTYLKPGGRLVINAIRKQDSDRDQLSRLDFSTHLWLEKEIKSVANVTRKDVSGFLEIAARIPILPEIKEYSLDQANKALSELKKSKIRGAKVLVMQNR